MTPQQLKNSILQLAIQGRLVKQRPEEGTAEELYAQIQAEKQKLIKEGKIKKEKPLPEITEDEKPFELPEGWIWVRLGSVVTMNPKNDLSDETETAFVPMACVSDGYGNEHTYEVRKWREIKKGFTHFADGDIGIAKITPCFQNRKSIIFENLKNGFGAGTTELSIVRVINDTLYRCFLLWFFKSDYFISKGIKSFSGTAGQQRIHKDYLSTCPFPLPPLAEQKRIVAKIEELLPYTDRYEQAWSKLEDFNKRFPTDMQKSILQMAIQGKLVEQRPEEGTGEELFTQIQAEKQRLIQEGKLKKEKPLSEITEGEKPFEIPVSWKWVRVGEIFDVIRGSSPRPKGSPLYWAKEETDFHWITIKDISVYATNGKLSKTIEYLTAKGAELSTFVDVDELIIAVSGSTTGKHCILGIKGYIYDGLAAVLNPTKIVTSDFVCMFFDWVYEKLNSQKIGSAFPNINTDVLKNTLFPLPPLAEQKRIVAKLEEILPLCEKLKK